MNCPKCGYAMGPFDTECERCKRMGAEARRSARRRQVQADTTLQDALHSPLPRPVCYALIALLALSVPVSWTVDHRKEEARKRAVAQANARAQVEAYAAPPSAQPPTPAGGAALDITVKPPEFKPTQEQIDAKDRLEMLASIKAKLRNDFWDGPLEDVTGRISGNKRDGFQASGNVFTAHIGYSIVWEWHATVTWGGDHWDMKYTKAIVGPQY